jgi:cysteine synthase A
MDAALTRNMVEAARQIAQRTGGYCTDQLSNADQIAAYREMGEEIWIQTGGRVDAFVQSTGTTASVQGVAEALHRHAPDIRCVAVEPSESPVLSGGRSGVHKIEGVGAGFVVPLWRPEAVDEIATVSTEEAMDTARRLAQAEGILAGTSTGGNVATAIKLGQRLGPDATVVTLMCDSGVKYLSTALYGSGPKAVKEWSRPA